MMQAKSLKLFFQLICFFCIGVPANAELQWERIIYEAKAKEGAKEERAVYRFQNRGDYPVTIGKVQASCGCTAVELGKKRYEPGEQGELTAVFTFGNRKGMQEKSITVETDDSKRKNYVLLLRVELPDVISRTRKKSASFWGSELSEELGCALISPALSLLREPWKWLSLSDSVGLTVFQRVDAMP